MSVEKLVNSRTWALDAHEGRADNPRRPIEKSVTAIYGGKRQPCTLRDLSPNGAGLIVHLYEELPNRFDLDLGGRIVTARVVWRRRNRVGVRLNEKRQRTLKGMIARFGF